jgi:hypothetical protein
VPWRQQHKPPSAKMGDEPADAKLMLAWNFWADLLYQEMAADKWQPVALPPSESSAYSWHNPIEISHGSLRCLTPCLVLCGGVMKRMTGTSAWRGPSVIPTSTR